MSESKRADEAVVNQEQETMLEEVYREMQRMNAPGYMATITLNQLYENVYQSRAAIIDGLLYTGTYLFAGAPKVGKSFFMAQLAYHVSTGQKLWQYEVHPGTVLYLALEDDYQRLQERMFRMFGVEGTDRLHFAVCAKQLNSGLDEQLRQFMKEHPDTNVVEMDCVEGKKGESRSILTFTFRNCNLMLMFLLEYQDQECVLEVFVWLETVLGQEAFK